MSEVACTLNPWPISINSKTNPVRLSVLNTYTMGFLTYGCYDSCFQFYLVITLPPMKRERISWYTFFNHAMSIHPSTLHIKCLLIRCLLLWQTIPEKKLFVDTPFVISVYHSLFNVYRNFFCWSHIINYLFLLIKNYKSIKNHFGFLLFLNIWSYYTLL